MIACMILSYYWGKGGGVYQKKIYEFSKYCLVLFLDEYIKGCGFFLIYDVNHFF